MRSTLSLAVPLACLALGLPGCLGLAAGAAPRDWIVPLGLVHLGGFGLRTAVYVSVFLAAFGAIRLAGLLVPGLPTPERPFAPQAPSPRAGPGPGVPGRSGAPDGECSAAAPSPETESTEAAADGTPADMTRFPETDSSEGLPLRLDEGAASEGDHTGLAEPLYGFLPKRVQERLAVTTGYQALLYTKVSILLSGAIGLLLAGSWEPASAADPIPADVALRIGAGGFLMAESVHRYLLFARREVSGTLIGWIAHGAVFVLRGRR